MGFGYYEGFIWIGLDRFLGKKIFKSIIFLLVWFAFYYFSKIKSNQINRFGLVRLIDLYIYI